LPWWFEIYLGLFVLSLITGAIRRLPKFRRRAISLSKDKRDRLVHNYLKLIKYYKIMFILIPLYLFILPYMLYCYVPHHFIYGTAMLIMMYIMIFVSFIDRKSLLKDLQEGEAKESNCK